MERLIIDSRSPEEIFGKKIPSGLRAF